MYVCMYVCMYVWRRICICMCIQVHALWKPRMYVYVYIYIYVYGAPAHVPTFFCVLHFLYLFSGEMGEHSLVLVVYLMCCLLVLLVLWEMGEHYLVLIRGPAGIGSNTRVLDPIPAWIEDRRLRMHGKASGAASLIDLRSQAGIG